ncbi:MAG: DUF1501 domain-containing protein [Pirellulaceae bacterium]
MPTYCDGLRRRELLKAGLLGGVGLGLADLLSMEARGEVEEKSRGKSAIFIYLDGGQSHLDSWDMKPEGGDIAGEFKPIDTNLPGLRVCEHMPRLARQADKYAVLRGVKGAIGVHGRGMQLVRSGNRPRASLVYPDLSSVVSKEFRSPVGVPPFVSLPIKTSNATTETAGYLGVAYRSFAVGGDPSSKDFSVRALSTPDGMKLSRVDARRSLMHSIDTAFQNVELENENLDGMDRFYQQAFDILRSQSTREAFDLSREKDEVRDQYGRTSVGQACLLARRLVEVGVRAVTIDFGGWDTHQNNFTSLKNDLLPPWDAALAALLEDLDQRGLLETTLVFSSGEMGRTPTINENAGRDHWGTAMSMLMAGAGVRGGQVLGATDEKGADVTDVAGTPEDVAASCLQALGIDSQMEYATATGRPIQIIRDGAPIGKLFS